MRKLDDTGIAYGFMMIIVFLIFAGFILALLSPVVNGLIYHENKFIEAGDVSIQTQNAVAWNVGGFIMAIIITLIGAFYWVVVRANEQKQYGGGGG